VATLTIRDLDDDVKARLRVVAAENGRSMEAEARAILAEHLGPPRPVDGLGTRIHAAFGALGGVELDIPARHTTPRAAEFDR
jgi:antitoxin FitA